MEYVSSEIRGMQIVSGLPPISAFFIITIIWAATVLIFTNSHSLCTHFCFFFFSFHSRETKTRSQKAPRAAPCVRAELASPESLVYISIFQTLLLSDISAVSWRSDMLQSYDSIHTRDKEQTGDHCTFWLHTSNRGKHILQLRADSLFTVSPIVSY